MQSEAGGNIVVTPEITTLLEQTSVILLSTGRSRIVEEIVDDIKLLIEDPKKGMEMLSEDPKKAKEMIAKQLRSIGTRLKSVGGYTKLILSLEIFGAAEKISPTQVDEDDDMSERMLFI
jgi:hypothetical protein